MSSPAASSVRSLLGPVIDQVNDIVVITTAGNGPDGSVDPKIVFVNPAFTRMTGYTADEALDRNPRFLQSPSTDPAACARIRAALEARRPIREQLLNVTKDGRAVWLDLNIIPLADQSGVITHFAAIERDITAQKATETALSSLASTDELTGVANRRGFLVELDHEIARVRRSRRPLALIAADLDHFKRVNDAYGHDVGDAVLAGFADVARHSLREIDLIGRIGGEEFDIIVRDTDRAGAVRLAKRLAKKLRFWRLHTGQAAISITASFGVTEFEGPEDTADAMLKRADRLLYAAKAAGRDRVCSDA